MGQTPHEDDEKTDQQHGSNVTADPEGKAALECLVVHNQDRPDRCTITPRECAGEAKLTNWMSADRTACIDLEERR